MKHALLFLLLFAAGKTSAQIPAYFTTGTGWLIESSWTDGQSDCYYQQYYAVRDYGEDTLIGGVTYRKLRAHGFLSYVPSQWCNLYLSDTLDCFIFVRQECKKIYHFDAGYGDTLAYDFDLGVGDTVAQTFNVNPYAFSETCPAIVDSIDSISVLGYYRKVFHLRNGYDYLEGIGTTRGFIGQSENIVCPFEQNSELLCYAIGDIAYYPAYGPGTCVFNLGLAEAQPLEFSLSPNPAGDYLQITLPNGELPESIAILDLQGRQQFLSADESGRLCVSHLSGGAYLVHVKLNGREGIRRFVR